MPSLAPDEIRMLAQSVSQYLDGAPSVAAAQWHEFASLGWLGLTVGTSDGGLDGGAAGLAAVMHGFGRGLIAAPLLSTGVIGATLVEKAGSPAQRATLLPAIIEGRLKLALADREPDSGHERGRRNLRADQTSTGYRLDGQKQFVADYDTADRLIVSARIAAGGLALFLVDKPTAGLAAAGYHALDGRPVADLRLENVQVTTAARLPGDAAAALDAAYALATIGVCAEAAGITGAMNAMTLDYLKIRRQFGVPLGHFQVLQHRMVDMTVGEMELSALLERAVEMHDSSHADVGVWISAAKARTDITARAIAEAAVQLHGGMGMTSDLKIGAYLKRLLVIGSIFGNAAWHTDRIAASWQA